MCSSQIRRKFIISSLLFLSIYSKKVCSNQIETKGSVTGLKIPRYVSIKKNKANIRRGPGTSYKIDWVYNLKGFPLQIFAEYGAWRKVKDYEGSTGWIHSKLLSGKRTIIFLNDETFLRNGPSLKSNKIALINKDVVAEFVDCKTYWCKIRIDNKTGWVFINSIWGIDDYY
mgnify:CR=1 FL=1